jgi:hypothetical protein
MDARDADRIGRIRTDAMEGRVPASSSGPAGVMNVG